MMSDALYEREGQSLPGSALAVVVTSVSSAARNQDGSQPVLSRRRPEERSIGLGSLEERRAAFKVT